MCTHILQVYVKCMQFFFLKSDFDELLTILKWQNCITMKTLVQTVALSMVIIFTAYVALFHLFTYK